MSKKILRPGQTIGIIGGGQLGKMMTTSAKEAGFRVIILDPAKDSPAGQVADEQIMATYDDRQALQELAHQCDVITYEFENIDYEALCWLTEKVYVPQGADLILTTQDRTIEKEALVKSGVEVAPYTVVYEADQLQRAVEQIGLPSVLKTARGGYDGKGQYVLKTLEDIDEARKLLKSGTCVLEAWIPFEKEISVVMTRTVDGDLQFFPVGENIHVHNILHQTIVPARISDEVLYKAKQLGKKIADQLQFVGTFAVEMFVTKENNLYVNELAPRPHNSGHYTIEACNASQFDQHIRAICGWPLQEIELLRPAIMVNVLGQHLDGLLKEIPNQRNWSIHLYGKEEAKHDRKMGHITVLTNAVEMTLQNLNEHLIWKKH